MLLRIENHSATYISLYKNLYCTCFLTIVGTCSSKNDDIFHIILMHNNQDYSKILYFLKHLCMSVKNMLLLIFYIDNKNRIKIHVPFRNNGRRGMCNIIWVCISIDADFFLSKY